MHGFEHEFRIRACLSRRGCGVQARGNGAGETREDADARAAWQGVSLRAGRSCLVPGGFRRFP